MIEAKRQGEKYRLLRHYSAVWSSCYSNDYLVQLYVADLDIYNDKKMVFINVGANKGYTIATWLSLWMPHIGINPRVLGHYLRTKINLNDCGACDDCREEGFLEFNSSLRINKAIEIYAFEPQPKTYEILTQIKQWMNASFMYIYQTALGNQTAIGSLQKCPPGGEVCGLETNANITSENYIATKVTTLDKFLEEQNITEKIDLLKIDTEVFDPLVIQGAKDSLNRHQVRLFIFEYHGIGMWPTTTLYQVVMDLERKDYVCYKIGQTGILRVTGCWSSVFEIKTWSNVLCISRREPRLISFIEKLLIPF
ncbi:unnamed protein product [Rotaria sp. Silwood1]|nr:unnamed protein product [Rotaria sp. Silwood1]CAF3411183.1 unnamed protein product [Rotaria sp. Silwood1]CAF4715324.1 unnamed protein product [Rotaria sp. Silwood1]CAF4718492.1 unnamed protein product [Rotaria sp. Silwood1]CAF5029458.1 unnamed protein product [Rotaria sp. Silwood1]